MLDLNWREIVIFAPMIAVVLWMGIYPDSFLKPMQPAIAGVRAARARRRPAHPAPHLAER